MRLYIIRHGETSWNRKLLLQGQTDIPLNEKGREFARKTSEGMKDIPIDLVITSPLCRAVETAALVLGDRAVPVIKDERIQEIGFGIMEGGQVRNEKGQVTDPVFYNFFHEPEKYVPMEGGETISALYERTGAFLEELKAKKEWQDKSILVSTHGAASRGLLASIRKTPIKEFWGKGVPKNCAVSIVDLENGQWIIREQDVVYYEDV